MINLVYICDQNYSIPARVSMKSVIRANACSQLRFFVMGDSLSNAEKHKFLELKEKNIDVIVIDISNEKLDIGWHHSRVSRAAVAKFYIARFLENIDRVIYLDCDVIVRKSLIDLTEIDLDGYYSAQVVDVPTIFELKWNQKIGTKNYYSSGVMVLNLDKIRRDCVEEKLIKAKKSDQFQHFMDQDAFNIAFDGYVKTISLKYNVIYSIIRKYQYDEIKDIICMSEAEFKECLYDPVIIHYADSNKPWNSINVDRADWWFEYVNRNEAVNVINSILNRQERSINEKYDLEITKIKEDFVQIQKQYDARFEEINNNIISIMNSKSYKIGRMITFIPRKIRKLYEKG